MGAPCLHTLASRLVAFGLALPMLGSGVAPASASVASHVMVPGVNSAVPYELDALIDPDSPPARRACQDRPLHSMRCYSPQQIQTAYNFSPLHAAGLNGAGRTIAIIDAFQNPFIRSDLHTFDMLFSRSECRAVPAGSPPCDLLPDPALNIVPPDGLTPFVPTNEKHRTWAGEIALDVQWAHAMAPGATINLVLAKSDQDADINSALAHAVDNNLGDVISMSFGEGEACMTAADKERMHEIFRTARKKGITLIAASGDSGAGQPDCNNDGHIFLSASIPATDPLVTSVGGTTLNANATTGAYIGETAWNDVPGSPSCRPPASACASGGGFSTVFRRPSYQKKKDGLEAMRGVPDVAYNGGLNGGVLVVFRTVSGQLGLFMIGGTSAGAPQWSALVAIADQQAGRRLGGINASLNDIARSGSAALRDVTTGNNFVGIGAGNAPQGFNAAPGWDPVTGWGTPNAASLVPLLVAAGPDISEGH